MISDLQKYHLSQTMVSSNRYVGRLRINWIDSNNNTECLKSNTTISNCHISKKVCHIKNIKAYLARGNLINFWYIYIHNLIHIFKSSRCWTVEKKYRKIYINETWKPTRGFQKIMPSSQGLSKFYHGLSMEFLKLKLEVPAKVRVPRVLINT